MANVQSPINPPSAPENFNAPAYVEDKSIAEMFLTTNGRLNRLRYFKRALVIGVASTILAFAIVAATMTPSGDDISMLGYVLFAVMCLVTAVPHFMLMIRRLHDLDKDGLFVLLMLIPAVNSIFALYLLFAPGTRGANKYGADPIEGLG
ncbi:MAG: DUF805 domain-containing protein [Selenomonadaceae bacterium]|nr:DUF805 domain-containing protein [Selenomonadaceae bacterium]